MVRFTDEDSVVTDPSDDPVWLSYKSTGDRAARDTLIERYLPLVRYVAHRLGTGLPSSVDQNDLASYGVFGLIDAIDKFEADRKVKFETYATKRIRGAIIDQLRAIDWAPRSLRARATALKRATSKLEHQLMRSPTTSEIAAELKVPESQVEALAADLSRAGLVSLDEMLQEDGEEVWAEAQARSGSDSLFGTSPDLEEMQLKLAQQISTSPERERMVLTLYYKEKFTFSEIGVILGVTESRVGQLHAKAVQALREEVRRNA